MSRSYLGGGRKVEDWELVAKTLYKHEGRNDHSKNLKQDDRMAVENKGCTQILQTLWSCAASSREQAMAEHLLQLEITVFVCIQPNNLILHFSKCPLTAGDRWVMKMLQLLQKGVLKLFSGQSSLSFNQKYLNSLRTK